MRKKGIPKMTDTEIHATAVAVCDADERQPRSENVLVGDRSIIANSREGTEFETRIVYAGRAIYAETVGDLRRIDRKFVSVDHRGGYWLANRKRFLTADLGRWREHSSQTAVMKVGGKGALAIIAEESIEDDHLATEMLRAIDSAHFAFMSEVKSVAVAKPRTRAQRKAARVFAVQLDLAWDALVSVRDLEADPSLETLSKSCRAVSALHQGIHAPENFKLAANS